MPVPPTPAIVEGCVTEVLTARGEAAANVTPERVTPTRYTTVSEMTARRIRERRRGESVMVMGV
jgi:hypothetical protein